MYALSGDCPFESITIALKGITVSWVWMKNDDNSEQNDFSRENGLWFQNRKLFTGTLVYGPPAGFPNGFIKAKIKDGLREGLVEICSSNERVWEKNYYKEGNLHGICTMYEFDDEPTFTSKTSNYRDGVLHGVVKAFWDKDTLSEISEWKNGKLHGISELYDEKGKLEEREVYRNGDLVEK